MDPQDLDLLPQPQPLPTERMRVQLLQWYSRQGRDLPWRQTQDPYAIWVSEVMLQQTQVATVIPYYQRWLKSLPTIATLAAASRDQVLKLWEGLGYYRRAVHLHQAAQWLAQHRQSEFPTHYEQVLALPGIGRTTAGGILSAALNQPLPILDGNVKRILARLLALPSPPNQSLPHLWEVSESLLDPLNPRDFNQALMDLGATLCRPRQPLCSECPWQGSCSAYNQGQVHRFPMTQTKPERPHRLIAVGVVFRGSQVLIAQRLETSMLGGLWEFPGGKLEPGETMQDCVAREIEEEVGIRVEVQDLLAAVDHTYTHFSITLSAFICRYLSGDIQALQCADVRWIDPSQLVDYAFPMANQKLFPPLAEWLRLHHNPSQDRNGIL